MQSINVMKLNQYEFPNFLVVSVYQLLVWAAEEGWARRTVCRALWDRSVHCMPTASDKAAFSYLCRSEGIKKYVQEGQRATALKYVVKLLYL